MQSYSPFAHAAIIVSSRVANSIIKGGNIFMYLCSALLLKSIVFMVCEHECMNIAPPPNYRVCLATDCILFGCFSPYLDSKECEYVEIAHNT